MIEEVTRLAVPVFAEKDRRKLIDTKETRKPITRRIVREEAIRAPIEKRKIIQEVWASESVRVYEETAPIVGGTLEKGQLQTKELKSEVHGTSSSIFSPLYQLILSI